jgi:hypothetical protein
MDGVDDLGGLLDEFVAAHVLHRQLLNLRGRSLLGLAGSTTPISVKHATWFDTIQLENLKRDG